jgi:hypothetical protein
MIYMVTYVTLLFHDLRTEEDRSSDLSEISEQEEVELKNMLMQEGISESEDNES